MVMQNTDPFNQPDTVDIKWHIGQFLLAIFFAPFIFIATIIIPMWASTLKTTREMEAGIVILSLFALVLAVCLFKAARR